MRKFPLTFLALVCGSFSPLSLSAPERTQEELLLEQIQAGEYSNRIDIIEQALYRLESIDPKNPELIAAKIRQLLRKGDRQEALKELDALKAVAPDSDAYKQAKASITFNNDESELQLENIRLLVKAGNLQAAKDAYDELFQGNPPSIDIAVEYWQLVARFPDQLPTAIEQLQSIDRKTPGNPSLREALVRMLFSNKEQQQGFALLRQMAADTPTKEVAATMWLNRLKSMPTSPDSVAALQDYLTFYEHGTHAQEAQALLEQQQKDLADPAFVARQVGLAMVREGKGAQAIPSLKKALDNSPDDAQIAAALATAYKRQGNRSAAIAYYEQANRLDKNHGRWDSEIARNRYWLLIQEGGNALKAKRFKQAREKYRQANAINQNQTEALLGLGSVAAEMQDSESAIRYFQRVLKMEPNNQRALNRLTNVYLTRSPEAAYSYLTSLSPGQKKIMRERIRSLRSNILQTEAKELAEQQRWPEVESRLTEARTLTPENVWLNYQLARAMSENGNAPAADALLDQLSVEKPNDVNLAYAHALYLSSSGRTEQALYRLQNLPRDKWNENLTNLEQRLRLNNALETAERMREDGNEEGAIIYLQRQQPDIRIDAALADWAAKRGDSQSALAFYRRTLARDPNETGALLGEAESYIALGDSDKARESLMQIGGQPNASINMQRRIANAWMQIDEPQKANEIYQAMRQRLQDQTPSQESGLVWRDIARSDRFIYGPQRALDDYRQAMVASGITDTFPADNENFTRLTRTQAGDDWLKRSIRADGKNLYQQQNTIITLDQDYWGSSGKKGMSDLSAHTTMLEIESPLDDGKVFARVDYVYMNAGTFSTGSDGKYYERFGACYVLGCDSDFSQKANGASFGLGWRDARWDMDIGTTPLGFEVIDWVGGINYKTKLSGIGWTFTASRRPISSSLLSFAGTKDPITGNSWGGVRATGGAVNMSYDQGNKDGVWASASAHQITGKNVEDNYRMRLMGGYYRRLISEVDREVTIGLTSMLWHYDKDLSGYTLGRGGYYSPQRYFSLSMPINYRQRTDNWSWQLAGSVGKSFTSKQDGRRYPIYSLVEEGIPDANAMQSGGSGGGFGYTARALVERRLTSHWSVGTGIDLQKAKDYTPSHAMLYLRYNFNGWRGDMDMPPRPLTPYADFK